MYDTFKKIRDLLSPEERRGFYMLFGMMIVSGFVEMITVASIAPFLAIVARPSIIETNATVAGLYAMLGFSDVQSFLVFIGGAVFVIVFFGLLFSTLTQYLMYRFTAMRAASDRPADAAGLSAPALYLVPQPAQRRSSSASGARRGQQGGASVAAAGDEDHRPRPITLVFLIALLVAGAAAVACTAAILIGGSLCR